LLKSLRGSQGLSVQGRLWKKARLGRLDLQEPGVEGEGEEEGEGQALDLVKEKRRVLLGIILAVLGGKAVVL
jgi:hypothetical protein